MSNIRKIIGVSAIAAGIVVSNLGATSDCAAKDPGKAGKATHRVIKILPGSTRLTSSHYGIWHPSDYASPKCRWVVLDKKHRVVQSGGQHDAMIIGYSMKGSTAMVGSACVELHK